MCAPGTPAVIRHGPGPAPAPFTMAPRGKRVLLNLAVASAALLPTTRPNLDVCPTLPPSGSGSKSRASWLIPALPPPLPGLDGKPGGLETVLLIEGQPSSNFLLPPPDLYPDLGKCSHAVAWQAFILFILRPHSLSGKTRLPRPHWLVCGPPLLCHSFCSLAGPGKDTIAILVPDQIPPSCLAHLHSTLIFAQDERSNQIHCRQFSPYAPTSTLLPTPGSEQIIA